MLKNLNIDDILSNALLDREKVLDFVDARRLKVYKGDTIAKTNTDDYNNLRLSLVISHCDEDM